jgi:putative copper resistance protein D
LVDPLIWVRAIHFASTVSVAGVVFFLLGVAEPAFAKADHAARIAVPVRRHLIWLAWIALLLVAISGAAWLILLAQRISDGSLTAVFRDGIVWIVLTRTGFGSAWAVRLVLVALLATFLPLNAERGIARPAGAVFVAACVCGSLAFAGHAAAGDGIEGTVHLTADILHLVAAAAWVGALVPLALLLHAANDDPFSIEIAREATRRFSTLGVASVGTLLATGIVNSWVLAGSIPALFGTDYGQLLLVKIALFLVMVSIAAVNRLRLTPRLVQSRDASAGQRALRRLRNNSLIEATVGAVILAIVAVLGTLPPGLEDQNELADCNQLACQRLHHSGLMILLGGSGIEPTSLARGTRPP